MDDELNVISLNQLEEKSDKIPDDQNTLFNSICFFLDNQIHSFNLRQWVVSWLKIAEEPFELDEEAKRNYYENMRSLEYDGGVCEVDVISDNLCKRIDVYICNLDGNETFYTTGTNFGEDILRIRMKYLDEEKWRFTPLVIFKPEQPCTNSIQKKKKYGKRKDTKRNQDICSHCLSTSGPFWLFERSKFTVCSSCYDHYLVYKELQSGMIFKENEKCSYCEKEFPSLENSLCKECTRELRLEKFECIWCHQKFSIQYSNNATGKNEIPTLCNICKSLKRKGLDLPETRQEERQEEELRTCKKPRTIFIKKNQDIAKRCETCKNRMIKINDDDDEFCFYCNHLIKLLKEKFIITHNEFENICSLSNNELDGNLENLEIIVNQLNGLFVINHLVKINYLYLDGSLNTTNSTCTFFDFLLHLIYLGYGSEKRKLDHLYRSISGSSSEKHVLDIRKCLLENKDGIVIIQYFEENTMLVSQFIEKSSIFIGKFIKFKYEESKFCNLRNGPIKYLLEDIKYFHLAGLIGLYKAYKLFVNQDKSIIKIKSIEEGKLFLKNNYKYI